MKRNGEITVGIKVPVAIDRADRPKFERAIVKFLFGADRVRPEFAEALSERGVDIRNLQRLSVPATVGACDMPDAHEFIPDESLADYCAEHGISLTHGGRVHFAFDYDHDADRAGDRLDISLAFDGDDLPQEQLGSVVQALFGNCELAADAQRYLRANGVDMVRFGRANASLLPNKDTPITSRVDSHTEALLGRLGLRTDQFGKLNVVSSKTIDVKHPFGQDGIGWSKATCC